MLSAIGVAYRAFFPEHDFRASFEHFFSSGFGIDCLVRHFDGQLQRQAGFVLANIDGKGIECGNDTGGRKRHTYFIQPDLFDANLGPGFQTACGYHELVAMFVLNHYALFVMDDGSADYRFLDIEYQVVLAAFVDDRHFGFTCALGGNQAVCTDVGQAAVADVVSRAFDGGIDAAAVGFAYF